MTIYYKMTDDKVADIDKHYLVDTKGYTLNQVKQLLNDIFKIHPQLNIDNFNLDILTHNYQIIVVNRKVLFYYNDDYPAINPIRWDSAVDLSHLTLYTCEFFGIKDELK